MVKKTYRKTFTRDGTRYSVQAGTPEELAVRVAMKMRDLDEGKKRVTRHMTVNAWTGEWLEAHKRPSVSDVSYGVLQSVARTWIAPAIGAMRLSDVKPIHCQRALNALAGRSASLIRKAATMLAALFEAARDNGLVIDNPAARLSIPKGSSGTHRALTGKERAALLKVCGSHRHGLWALVMLYCGLRPGETERLMGRHIDLAGARLFVDGTKTKAAQRWVPIPKPLLPLLAEAAGRPFEPVFKGGGGGPAGRDARRRMWEALKRAMDIELGCRTFRGAPVPPCAVAPDLTPYCLRHTFCTDMQDAGVPITVAKDLMGHSSIAMTANIYTHQSEKSFEDARAALDALAAAHVRPPVQPHPETVGK